MMRELMIGDKVKAIKEAFAVDVDDCGTVVSIDGLRENPFTHEMESRVTVEMESTGIQIDTEEGIWALVDDAGRALLPAGGAVDAVETIDPHAAYKEYLVAREKAWDLGAAFIDYGTWLEQRLAVRDADLAAALARAQAAEGVSAEKMALEYGDGYAAGVADGIRDLIHDLDEAYDGASAGMRLPALEQVIEKYKTMYLK